MSETASLAPFCPHCGQDLDHSNPHSHLRSFWEELMEMGLHFDHRNFRSLPLLPWPGELPKRFNSEHKARFTPPLKIYIFIAAIFFALLFTKQHGVIENTNDAPHATIDLEIEGSKDHSAPDDFWGKLVEYLKTPKTSVDKEQLIHRADKFAFAALILSFPLISAWLLLLYRKTRIGFWQHMAFVLYTQASIFAFASLHMGLDLLPYKFLHIPDNWAFMICGIFLFVALKRCYPGSWRKTAAKFSLLVFGYFLAVGTMVGLGFCAALLWTLIQSGSVHS